MQPSKNTLSDIKNPQTAWLWYGLSALVVGIDQLSKVYFENNFQLYQTVSVIEPIFNFTLAHNYGAAFSFLADQGGCGVCQHSCHPYLNQATKTSVALIRLDGRTGLRAVG